MNNSTDTRTEAEQVLHALKMATSYQYEWQNSEVREENGKRYLYLPIKNGCTSTTTS